MISVLFARQDSIYKSLDCDVWDIDRNAKNYEGPNAVICHPPCRAWGCLRGLAKPRPGERELAPWAITQVREFGGVLEHPRASLLWKELNLPLGRNIDAHGGFTICINQSWFGHRAEKKTLLYIVGISPKDLPAYPVTFDLPTHVIMRHHKSQKKHEARGGSLRPTVTKKEREQTPELLAKWLILVASKCSVNNLNTIQ